MLGDIYIYDLYIFMDEYLLAFYFILEFGISLPNGCFVFLKKKGEIGCSMRKCHVIKNGNILLTILDKQINSVSHKVMCDIVSTNSDRIHYVGYSRTSRKNKNNCKSIKGDI